MATDPVRPTHLHLALEACRLGQYETVIALIEAAAPSQQDGINAYLCAAYAAAQLHGEARALRWVERALAWDPRHTLALSTQSNLLRVLHRLEEARDSCERWISVEPQSSAAHWCAAHVYQGLQCHEQAIAAFTQAAKLMPHPAAALTDLAILYFELGCRAEAWQTLDQVFAADGLHAAAWYTRAEAKKYQAGDADIELMEQQVRRHAADPAHYVVHDTILLRYALAKAHTDLEDFPRALLHLEAGSSLKRSTLNYEPAIDERYMRSVEVAFSMHTIQRFRGAGSASSRPIFIVGMPRSGTSLLEQILASHPQVHGGGESARVQRLLQDWGDGYPECIDSLGLDGIGAMANRYLKMLPSHAAAHITDKTPYNFMHIGLLHVMFPNARIIHCIRDPLDTCTSVYSKLFTQGNEFSYDLVELGRYYRAYLRLMAHWRSVIPPDRLVEVEYEKLTRNLEGESRRVTEACGVPWSDACLMFHQTQRSVRTASLHQVREPLYQSSIGRARLFAGLLGPLQAALADTPPVSAT